VRATNPDFSIREARETDAGGLARLLIGIGWFSALKKMTPEALEAQVRAQLGALCRTSLSTTLVAESANGALLGYCNVHWLAALFLPGPEGYLSELFLLPVARGQGIGRAFLHRVVAEAEVRGAYRLTLLNGKHRESYDRGFYTKNGWEERDLMANFVYWVEAADPSGRPSLGEAARESLED
jgi:GNAT superfamily N-acetyltransferase